jgi:hypothetical protein
VGILVTLLVSRPGSSDGKDGKDGTSAAPAATRSSAPAGPTGTEGSAGRPAAEPNRSAEFGEGRVRARGH